MATHAEPVSGRLKWEQLELIYSPEFDLSQLPEEQRKELSKHKFNSTFSTALVIILHFLTLSIFTMIYFGLKHSKLPLIRDNDFGAGKAIGFSFIPFFNLYWDFRFWLRLVNRINFQFKLRNQPMPLSRGLTLATVIMGVIPYVDLLSLIVFFPIIAGQIQNATNRLAKEFYMP